MPRLTDAQAPSNNSARVNTAHNRGAERAAASAASSGRVNSGCSRHPEAPLIVRTCHGAELGSASQRLTRKGNNPGLPRHTNGGVDVRATSLVAQVNMHMVPIGRPDSMASAEVNARKVAHRLTRASTCPRIGREVNLSHSVVTDCPAVRSPVS